MIFYNCCRYRTKADEGYWSWEQLWRYYTIWMSFLRTCFACCYFPLDVLTGTNSCCHFQNQGRKMKELCTRSLSKQRICQLSLVCQRSFASGWNMRSASRHWESGDMGRCMKHILTDRDECIAWNNVDAALTGNHNPFYFISASVLVRVVTTPPAVFYFKKIIQN